MSRYHVRVLVGVGIWAVAVGWALFFPGGSHAQTGDLLSALVHSLFGRATVNTYLFAHFALMGVWPWIILQFWAGETPFRGKLWSKLTAFLLSNVVGAFAALPYEALRRAEPMRLPPRWFFRFGMSRWVSLALLALSTLLLMAAVAWGNLSEYLELVQTNSFVRVMLLDFLLFHLVALRLLLRDSRDRDSRYHPAQFAVFLVPLYGPLLYLLFRKQLEAAHPAMLRM